MAITSVADTPPAGSQTPDGASEKAEMDKTMHEHIEGSSAEMMPIPEDFGDGKLTKETILAFLALAGQINAYIMSMLVPSTMLPYINAELGPSPSYVWITICWTLGAANVTSVAGRLSDIFGRRYFMMTGALISIVGTLVGATGHSITQMIVSGALFGIGSGFQELCYACVQEVVPNRYRVPAVGALDVSLALAFTSPVISYVIIAFYSDTVGWRGAYWYLFAFHCVAFLMLFFFYDPPDFAMKYDAASSGKSQKEIRREQWRLVAKMDWVGVALFVSGGVLFLVGVNFGGRTFPWSHPATIAPIVVGLCCYIAVGCWCAFADLEYPLFPPKLFRKIREFDMVIVVCFVGGMLYYSMNVLWPQESQALFVPKDDVIIKGVYAIIFSCGTWIAGLVTVFICSRLHHERWQIVGFTVVQTALIGSMSSVGVDDKAQAIATVVITAITITPPQLLSFTMLSFGLEDQRDVGVAVGLASTFRLLGGAVATAIYTAIYTTKYAEVLPLEMTAAISRSDVPYSDSLLSSLLSAAETGTTAAYEAVAGITPDLMSEAALAVKQAYVQGFSLVYLVAIAFGVVAVVCASCTVSTDRGKKNNARAVVLKNEVSAAGQRRAEEGGKAVV